MFLLLCKRVHHLNPCLLCGQQACSVLPIIQFWCKRSVQKLCVTSLLCLHCSSSPQPVVTLVMCRLLFWCRLSMNCYPLNLLWPSRYYYWVGFKINNKILQWEVIEPYVSSCDTYHSHFVVGNVPWVALVMDNF